jgi:hypothetical protein
MNNSGVLKLKILCPQFISSPNPIKNTKANIRKKRFFFVLNKIKSFPDLLCKYFKRKKIDAMRKNNAVSDSNNPSSTPNNSIVSLLNMKKTEYAKVMDSITLIKYKLGLYLISLPDDFFGPDIFAAYVPKVLLQGQRRHLFFFR